MRLALACHAADVCVSRASTLCVQVGGCTGYANAVFRQKSHITYPARLRPPMPAHACIHITALLWLLLHGKDKCKLLCIMYSLIVLQCACIIFLSSFLSYEYSQSTQFMQASSFLLSSRTAVEAVRPTLLVLWMHRADTATPTARILSLHPKYVKHNLFYAIWGKSSMSCVQVLLLSCV